MAVNSFFVEKTQKQVNSVVGTSSTASALLHELQLGEQLNESLSQTRRADFSLMLAMLAPDVREQSQFALPATPTEKRSPQSNAKLNAKLRAFFELPPKNALALTSNEQIVLFNQANMLNETGLEHLHLTNVLQPKPLAFRDDVSHIQTDVMTNTSLYCQLKYNQIKSQKSSHVDTSIERQINSSNSDNIENQSSLEPLDKSQKKSLNTVLNKPLTFNAKGWLKGVEDALVKAPLLA